ncbi:hypothetical protein BDV38DRAFT_263649 [Aspergillus pseudotamarii]|uniref:Uncharacterized protein n=1 Tax=Aspergillus pseudotamarii TaxID=132259 RepID=A0A5N6SAF2_ASPPS|nr:uncharacterized protein BDV38DRAFT_263649 [Aspergillus pseudotamarii]KAE8131706.1 hypothetical protein BDV38DRAFT_263649 [Aspergillus pseudotamarii]
MTVESGLCYHLQFMSRGGMSGCAEQNQPTYSYVRCTDRRYILSPAENLRWGDRSTYPSFHTKARHDRPVRLMVFAILVTLVILLRVMIIVWAFIGDPPGWNLRLCF